MGDVPNVVFPCAALLDGQTGREAGVRSRTAVSPEGRRLARSHPRVAAIAATRELYNAIPGPFQILSVPIERNPSEHLDGLSPAPGAPRRYLTAYAGLYRDLAANLARPPRRCLIVLTGSSETALARIAELVRRTAEEHGIRLRSVSDAELSQAASLLAGEGSVYHVGANLVEGPEALTLVTLGQRWPAQIEPGWTAPVLALSGLDAISMRSLRRAVSGQTQRNMLRDHFGGRRSQTDPMQTNRPLGPIAATSTYGPFGE